MNFKKKKTTTLFDYCGIFAFCFTLTLCSCDAPIIDINETNAKVELTATNVERTSITCDINITTKKTILLQGIRYSTEGGKVTEQHIDNGETSYTFNNLKANTKYYFTAFADITGYDDFVYSETLEVTTASNINGEYELVFVDEFDTDGKPASHWKPEIGLSIRNNEAQYYSNSEENAYVKDGKLHIIGRRNHLGYDYTSASLTTANSFVFCYGRLEVRAKIPIEGGSWPAIWTLGNDYNWPSNGEIDVMEYYSGKIMANACWGSDKQWVGVWDSSGTPVSHFIQQDADWKNKYHTWVMEWDEEYIRLLVDNELLNEIDLSKTYNRGGFRNNKENPFIYHKDGWGAYIVVNLALGGNNGGSIDNNAFPMEYTIDYVKVWQKKRLPEE